MASNGVESQQTFEEIEPFCKWKRGKESDILEVHLPAGTKKEQLKVQINSAGVLTITGECPLGGTRSIRFRREIKVSKDCKTTEVRAKFARGILRITLPKSNFPGHSNGKTLTNKETDNPMEEGIKRFQDDKVNLSKLKNYTDGLKRLGEETAVRVAVVVVVAAAAAIWAFKA